MNVYKCFICVKKKYVILLSCFFVLKKKNKIKIIGDIIIYNK